MKSEKVSKKEMQKYNRVPIEMVDASFLKTFKARLQRALSNADVSVHCSGVGPDGILGSLSNHTILSVIL